MKHRKHRRGLQRSHKVHARLYTITFRSLLKYCVIMHLTISEAIERSLLNEMKRHPQMCYNRGEIVAQLRAAEAGIHRLTSLAHAVTVAGSVKVPANIREKKPRQERRNEISDGTMAAFHEA